MTKVVVTFKSASTNEEGSLNYTLHDHTIAQRWKALVEKGQLLGSRFQTDDIFYGGLFTSIDELKNNLFNSLNEIRKEMPDLFKEQILSPIINNNFDINQTNLNITHVLYEKGIHEIQFVRKIQSHPIYFHLHKLNNTIHRLEAELHPTGGFFIDTRLFNSFRAKITPEENSLFSLDQKWGELYLNYCHVGESYLNIFYNNYPSPPVPQTDIAGGLIMQFNPTQIFKDHDALQKWLDQFFGRAVDIKTIPLGLVPLASLHGNWSPESIRDFFKQYPLFKGELRFE